MGRNTKKWGGMVLVKVFFLQKRNLKVKKTNYIVVYQILSDFGEIKIYECKDTETHLEVPFRDTSSCVVLFCRI